MIPSGPDVVPDRELSLPTVSHGARNPARPPSGRLPGSLHGATAQDMGVLHVVRGPVSAVNSRPVGSSRCVESVWWARSAVRPGRVCFPENLWSEFHKKRKTSLNALIIVINLEFESFYHDVSLVQVPKVILFSYRCCC